ncbi:MAG: primase-like DNA-binding domain-containing protein [Blautia faecis]
MQLREPQRIIRMTLTELGSSSRRGLKKTRLRNSRTSAAYQLYAKWCEENGYSSENQKNFKNAIGVHFKITRKRPKDGGGQTTMILGCRFRDVQEGAEDSTVQDAYKPKDVLL